MPRLVTSLALLVSIGACKPAADRATGASPPAGEAVVRTGDVTPMPWLLVGHTPIDESVYRDTVARKRDLEDDKARRTPHEVLLDLVDQARILAECERIGEDTSEEIAGQEDVLRSSVRDFDAYLASRGETLESWRVHRMTEACLTTVWTGSFFPEAPSEDELYAYYEAHPEPYTADAPWLRYAVVRVADASADQTGHPGCDALLGYFDACAAEQSELSAEQVARTRARFVEEYVRSSNYEWSAENCQRDIERMSKSCRIAPPAPPPPPRALPRAVLARLKRRALELREEVTQLAFADSFYDLRSKVGKGVYVDLYDATPTDEIEPRMAALLSGVEEGETSAPLLEGDMVLLLTVLDRYPEGLAPYEAVAGRVVHDVFDERVAAAWAAMWATLAERYPVHADPALGYVETPRAEHLGQSYER